MNKKDKMTNEYFKAMEDLGVISVIVVAVLLDTGAIEIIQNSMEIPAKMAYYSKSYDDDMCLRANPDIRIVSWMFA